MAKGKRQKLNRQAHQEKQKRKLNRRDAKTAKDFQPKSAGGVALVTSRRF